MIREPPDVVLRKHDVAVGDDIENAAMTLDELDLEAKLVADVGRQTGGLRQIASGDAVDDRNLHGFTREAAESVSGNGR